MRSINICMFVCIKHAVYMLNVPPSTSHGHLMRSSLNSVSAIALGARIGHDWALFLLPVFPISIVRSGTLQDFGYNVDIQEALQHSWLRPASICELGEDSLAGRSFSHNILSHRLEPFYANMLSCRQSFARAAYYCKEHLDSIQSFPIEK